MSVTIEQHDRAVVVAVVGDFDLRTAHEPYEALSALLEEGAEVDDVVVDLTAVDFVDSTGLGGLIRLQQEAVRHDIPVRLRGLGHRLRSLFDITGLSQEFTIEPVDAPAS